MYFIGSTDVIVKNILGFGRVALDQVTVLFYCV